MSGEIEVTLSLGTLLGTGAALLNLVVVGPLAWIVKSLATDVRDLKKETTQLKESLPVTYVRQQAYDRDIAEIKGMLKGIYERLERKVNREAE